MSGGIGAGRLMADRLAARVAAGMEADDPAFFEQVLKLRARRLARPRAMFDDGPQGQPVLCFVVGGERYAIALGDLAEVMPLASWTPVPGLPQHLLGVTNVRGEIRPVLDLHAMLSLPAPEQGRRSFVAFLRVAKSNNVFTREVGIRIDSFERIRFIDMGTLTFPHQAGNGLPQRFITGITPDTLILLDARQILAMDVLQDRRAAHRRAM